MTSDVSRQAGSSRLSFAPESALFEMGFTDFRVRVFHDAARLQLPRDQLTRALERREDIRTALRPHFETVLLDLKDRG